MEGNVGHADEADELAGGAEFGGKESEAVLGDVCLQAVDRAITLFGRERRGKELHDVRVGIDALEGLAVALLSGAEEQAGRLEHGYFGLRAREASAATRLAINCLDFSSARLPSALKCCPERGIITSGLLTVCMSRKTKHWRKWYWAREVPCMPGDAPMMAAGLPAQALSP